MLVAFAIIGGTSFVALFLYGQVLAQVKDTRMDFVRSTCMSQNKTHDDTYSALVAAAAKDEADRKTEAGKAEVRRRRDVTLGLIDLLAPKQDCEYLVKLSVGEAEPTPVPTIPKPTPEATP
jgi:hypothetical protein